MGTVTNAKKKPIGRPVLCDSAISDHSIVPPPPPPHQFRINPGSVIVLDHFFLDIEVILNILKATTGILYI